MWWEHCWRSSAGPACAQPAHRVGPSYLYPTAATPGVVNPDVTQANIQDTICKSGWTATIRPPASYTNALKKQQLAAPKFKDKMPGHYEEDHFISLELGGHPRDPKNIWPEMWGTPATPLNAQGPFPSHLVGAKTKDRVENALHKARLRRRADASRSPAHHRDGLVQVLQGEGPEVTLRATHNACYLASFFWSSSM